MKTLLIIVALSTVTLSVAQTKSTPQNPKIIETPITIIELDNSKMPAGVMPKTIFQCQRGKKTVYVDNPKTPGLTNCQSINQKELTKFQPKPSDNAPNQMQSFDSADNAQQRRIRRPVVTTVRPNTNRVTPSNVNANSNSGYRPPCGGVITYKGKTYLLPNDKPCPIPDTILRHMQPVPTN